MLDNLLRYGMLTPYFRTLIGPVPRRKEEEEEEGDTLIASRIGQRH